MPTGRAQLWVCQGLLWHRAGQGRAGLFPLPVPAPLPEEQPWPLRALLLELSPLPTIPLPFPCLRQALRPVSRPCRLPASFLRAIVALPPAGKRLRPGSPAGFPALGWGGRLRGAAGPRRGGGRCRAGSAPSRCSIPAPSVPGASVASAGAGDPPMHRGKERDPRGCAAAASSPRSAHGPCRERQSHLLISATGKPQIA